MIDNYIKSLKRGFELNRDRFLEMNNMTLEEMRQIHANKRFVEFVDKTELKKFEMSGYEQMLSRILEAPMKSAVENNNQELQNKLKMIQNQLINQPAIT